jgi:hypothetical protein
MECRSLPTSTYRSRKAGSNTSVYLELEDDMFLYKMMTSGRDYPSNPTWHPETPSELMESQYYLFCQKKTISSGGTTTDLHTSRQDRRNVIGEIVSVSFFI